MKILTNRIKQLVNQTLKPLNVGLVSNPYLKQLVEHDQQGSRAIEDIAIILELPDRHSSRLLKILGRSRSQLRQDLVVLSLLDFKRNGYFVEFGATNGFDLSNTYLLEKDFGWSGILAEPARCWHKDLRNNRDCHVETVCVWRDSYSILKFNEVDTAELSTIDAYSSLDNHHVARKDGKT